MNQRWKRQVFEHREPSPDGLAALRVRIDELEVRDHQSPQYALRWVAGLSASVVAVTLIALFVTASRGQPEPSRSAASDGFLAAEFFADRSGHAHPALIRYGLAEAPVAPITVTPATRSRVATVQVPLERQDVTLYWVSSTRSPEP